MAKADWTRRFPDPPVVPGAGELRTLADARAFLLALKPAAQRSAHWQLAAGMLLFAAEAPAAVMFADIAIRKALGAGKPATPGLPRRIAPPRVLP
jgi:hypothetical protein